ncbi:hypothetical protein Gotri_015083 [Gossypium trilobum]|uniref:Gnk2-homologous domain-containing protein n=1 Tax=Gossypium trilobum TaxID=34281 RepID=A0A7J9DZ73_9ROSI|nr:hypothetical protein [Gossypium trilobum]
MQDLVSQSLQRTFSIVAFGEDPNAINGLYHYRGDLSASQCYSCENKILKISDKVCGKAIAARVPKIEFFYKVCGSSLSGKTEFENRRGRSFNMAKEKVKSGSILVLKKPKKKPQESGTGSSLQLAFKLGDSKE